MSENLQNLQEWHELFQKGIISEEEFNVKKRELLGLPEIKQEKLSAKPAAEVVNNKKTTAGLRQKKIIVKKQESWNANQIFLIVVAILLLAGGGFWFWKKNSNSTFSEKSVADSTLTANSKNVEIDNNAAGHIENNVSETNLEHKNEISESTVFEKEAKRILQETAPPISQQNLTNLLRENYLSSDLEFEQLNDGGLFFAAFPVSENFIDVSVSAGTASSIRASLTAKSASDGAYKLLDIEKALYSVFSKLGQRYKIIRVYEGASGEIINGKKYIVFHIRQVSDPSCCTSLLVAVKEEAYSNGTFSQKDAIFAESEYINENINWEKL